MILGQDHPSTWNLDNHTCAKVIVLIELGYRIRGEPIGAIGE